MFRLVNPRRSLVSAGLALASAIVASVLGAAPAGAVPGGEFAVFAQCPLGAPGVTGCVAIRAESGEVTIGKLKAQVTTPQLLQGGFIPQEDGTLTLVGAAGGETLPRTPQEVTPGSVRCDRPGEGSWHGPRRHGWRDVYGRCKAIFENEHAGVYLTTELASPPSAIVLNLGAALAEQGIAISLPVKFKLEGPLLGDACYIGSDATPIVIDLTDGPAGALTGKLGQLVTNSMGTLLTITGATFVNDTFAAPAASGCGNDGRLDPLLDSTLGLPAPAGTNTAVLNGTHQQAESSEVEAHS